MKPTLSPNGFIQIAIIVEDIEKAARKWAELLGAPVPPIQDHTTTAASGVEYRGKPAVYGLKIAVIQMNGFILELHEPDKRDSTFREYLDKHGNGVHHLGFCVGEDRDAVIDNLTGMGYGLRTVGSNKGWTIVDTEDDLGVNLNIKPKP